MGEDEAVLLSAESERMVDPHIHIVAKTSVPEWDLVKRLFANLKVGNSKRLIKVNFTYHFCTLSAQLFFIYR